MGDSAGQALNQLISVGTSAGGARAKAVIGWNPDTGEMVAGQFDLPAGFEHWLLKFDGTGNDQELGPSQQYGRIEYAYSRMATLAGVTMQPCRLLVGVGQVLYGPPLPYGACPPPASCLANRVITGPHIFSHSYSGTCPGMRRYFY